MEITKEQDVPFGDWYNKLQQEKADTENKKEEILNQSPPIITENLPVRSQFKPKEKVKAEVKSEVKEEKKPEIPSTEPSVEIPKKKLGRPPLRKEVTIYQAPCSTEETASVFTDFPKPVPAPVETPSVTILPLIYDLLKEKIVPVLDKMEDWLSRVPYLQEPHPLKTETVIDYRDLPLPLEDQVLVALKSALAVPGSKIPVVSIFNILKTFGGITVEEYGEEQLFGILKKLFDQKKIQGTSNEIWI